MENPTIFYKKQVKHYTSEVKNLNKKLILLSTYRLVVFLLTCFGIYFFFSQWQVAICIGVIGISYFLFLLLKYTNIKASRDLNKALVALNEEEIKIASGNFHHRDQGLEFQDPNHFYSLDIDLFGKGSFFQFINRTNVNEGTQQLVNILTSNNILDIEKRQNAIKELSAKAKWRQYFSATASLINVETPTKHIINWLSEYQIFLPKGIKWIPLIFSVLSTAIILLISFEIIKPIFAILWFVLGAGITGRYLKKIGMLANNTSKLKDTFKQYALLLDQIENETFTSEILLKKQHQIQSETKKASIIFKELSRGLDALDNRNNLFVIFFGNGFLLTDIKNSYRIERWIEQYKHKIADWFEAISFFDAYNSLGNYTFNHSEFVFPEIQNQGAIISAINLGHPLLDKTKRIDSDVTINKEQFFIVTGANMAGKSTFLRTISLHIVMANSGLPVCADKSEYKPVKLITSMRTSDSLTDDSSYFFSELTRLKFIVDAIQKESYFIILDEILKGTNSTDKAIGSRKFVEKLVRSNATGIIATHDLSLCEITETLEEVKNYYFDAEIVNDELHFDYKLKQGICQNMNASFLLKKMEIV
ncbi:DNA mismatch repair protein MutS [Flavobacteriaceae bacterium AU392]|nr:DNA mismatch repair protein MutS [Flavobacteriaceae bacterium]RKM85024.1 DNA mismatch repair protein MutS [Flavobacteriaceae bacterium AU392]